jgi:hypothetical protein
LKMEERGGWMAWRRGGRRAVYGVERIRKD